MKPTMRKMKRSATRLQNRVVTGKTKEEPTAGKARLYAGQSRKNASNAKNVGRDHKAARGQAGHETDEFMPISQLAPRPPTGRQASSAS
jgi:hypothetical protein